MKVSLSFIVLSILASPLFAADKLPRLLETINDDHARGVTDLWTYNDIPNAMAQARKENKPLFVTFRCVPCRDCKGFDAEVANGSDIIAKMAKEHFIPVRQVEMKAVDLEQFQFDHDLNWAAMFINADGTVYARYGTQSAEGADAYNSIAGLKSTMERVLELHKNYPLNKESLSQKRGPKKSIRSALALPGMKNAASLEGMTTRKNCIHCHMIHDAENRIAQENGTFTNDNFYRYPLPQNIGLEIVRDHGTKIESIERSSSAANSGLKAGEEIKSINGQAIASIADMQFVLHHLPNENVSLKVTGSQSGTHQISLKKGWKKTDASWRGSNWSVSPRLTTWAPPLNDNKRKALNIPEDQGALEVKFINGSQPAGQAVKKAGIRVGDVLIEMGGKPIAMTNQQWNLDIKMNYKVGDKLPLTFLRNGKRRTVEVELVE